MFITIAEEGTYIPYIKDDNEVDYQSSKLVVGETEIPLQKEQNSTFLSGKEYSFKKGTYKAEYRLVPRNLLTTKESFILDSEGRSSESRIPIKSLNDYTADYKLSFLYRVIQGEPPQIFISDNASFQGGITPQRILDRELTDTVDGKWRLFEAFFKPKIGTTKAVLHIALHENREGGKSSIEIRNVSLTKIVTPVVVFVKDKQKILETPRIVFRQINPTVYIVKVKDAHSPFFLSFSEGFDRGWNMYIQNAEDKKAQTSHPIVARYFDGTVEEEKYGGGLGLSEISETFFQYTHDQNQVPINGFGNGWFVDKTGSYTMRLVFSPQKYTVIGTFISAVGFFGGLLLLVILFIRNKKKEK